MKLTFQAQSYKIREICLISQNLFYDWGIPEMSTQDIVLAIEEALTNIMEHGYKYDRGEPGKISMEISREKPDIKIIITDHAQPYSMANLLFPDLHQYIQSDIKGGFGISIMKKLMDTVQLKHSNGKNILTMIKSVPSFQYADPLASGRISTSTIEATVLDGILMVNAKPNSVIHLEEARNNLESYIKMIEAHPEYQVFAKVIDQRKMKEITFEARKYHIEKEPAHVKALALIEESFITRLFVNISGLFIRKSRAIKMFKTKSQAVRWVKKFANPSLPHHPAF